MLAGAFTSPSVALRAFAPSAGLLSFIVTPMIDMYVTMGWLENGFEAYIVAYGVRAV